MTARLFARFALVSILIAPFSLFAQVGPEFQVNSYTSSSQRTPSVAVDADGDFAECDESRGARDSESAQTSRGSLIVK